MWIVKLLMGPIDSSYDTKGEYWVDCVSERFYADSLQTSRNGAVGETVKGCIHEENKGG